MNGNTAMTIGARLHYVRTTLGLSIEEVSKKINVPEEEILENEQDQRLNFKEFLSGRDYELLNWYSSLFNCEVGYLMGECDYPFGIPVRVQLNERLDKLTDEQLSQLLKFVELYYDDEPVK